jgi:hypothetical protein
MPKGIWKSCIYVKINESKDMKVKTGIDSVVAKINERGIRSLGFLSEAMLESIKLPTRMAKLTYNSA